MQKRLLQNVFLLFAQKMKVVCLFRLSHKMVIACRAVADGAPRILPKIHIVTLVYQG